MNFIVTPVGGAASVVGFALMGGIAGTVVGIVGASIIGFGILTHFYDSPGSEE
jgi:hypothetical protein